MAEKSKYDTNPLDPEYARRTDDVWGARRGGGSSDPGAPTEDIRAATREVARTPNEQARQHEQAEAPTRRYDQPLSTSYPSVFIPPPPQSHPPAAFGATPPPTAGAAARVAGPPSSRTVPGINLPENVTTVLPYIPFYIGAIIGVVELFLVPRNEVRTRFHAAQGLALHMIVLVIGFLLRFASSLASSTLGGVASAMLTLVSVIFGVGSLAFFIISIIRVWKGEENRLAPLDDMTKWLNEKIEPRK